MYTQFTFTSFHRNILSGIVESLVVMKDGVIVEHCYKLKVEMMPVGMLFIKILERTGSELLETCKFVSFIVFPIFDKDRLF